MKKGRFESSASAKKHTKKVVALLLVMLLLVGAVVGTTLAWLTDSTTTITNTFTVGMVDIDLTETGADPSGNRSLKLVPGEDLEKDPTVTVNENSEACWVFVKIEEINNVTNYIGYEVATGWTQLVDGEDNPVAGVYYRQQAATDVEVDFEVLKDNKVTVSSTLTKGQLDAATASVPALKFTAYAIQQHDDIVGAYAAWELGNWS